MTEPPSLMGDRPEAQPVTSDSDYIQSNLSHGLRIWWALFWRTALLDNLFYTGPIVALHRASGSYWAYSINYVAALVMMFFVVRKRYRHFHIRLVSTADRTQTLEPTFLRTSRIWWTFTWRSIVYRVVLSFAMNVPLGFVTGAVAVIYPPLGLAFTVFAGLAIDAAVDLFIIYSSILDEEIADFCVTLVPNTSPALLPNSVSPSPATGI